MRQVYSKEGITVTNYREILRLKSQGYSERNIALAVSGSRNTVSDVLKRAASHQISWPLKVNTTNADLKKSCIRRFLTATNVCQITSASEKN